MATQKQIANFIQGRIALGRVQPGTNYSFAFRYSIGIPYWGPALPTVEELARALIQDGGFRALQLGSFFATPTGDFLEQAVELVIPRAFSPEFDLLVAAIKLAAELQQGESRGNALLALGGTVLIGVLLREVTKAA